MNFFCKLHPPRPSFAQDMSPEEGQLMERHAEYWREWMAHGHVAAFGLVGDPDGAYGIGIVEFEDFDAVKAFTDEDPTIRSESGFRFEVHPMPFGVIVP